MFLLHMEVPVRVSREFLSINYFRLGRISQPRGHVRVREDADIFSHYRMTSGLTDHSGLDRVEWN